jgi:hypothetical protein
MTVAVCFPACSSIRFRIDAQAHFLAYPHFYGGLGLSLHRCAVVRQYVSTSARMYVSASVRMYVSMSAELCVCPSVRTCLFKCLFPSMSIYLPCCFIVSVRKGIYKSAVCIVSPLRGSIWLRSGSLWRSSAPSRCFFTPYLCTQAAGQRSRCAYRTPAPSFFWAAGRYRSPDTFGVGNRQVYPQSVVYGFLCP